MASTQSHVDRRFGGRKGTTVAPLPASAVRALSVLLGLVLWQLVAVSFDSKLFPTATGSIRTLVVQLQHHPFRSDLLTTVGRVIFGFGLGSGIGLVIGVTIGMWPVVGQFIEPYINFFRFVSPIAWVAPATFWFGIGEAPKIALTTYVTMFLVAVYTVAGVARVHADRIRMAQVFGAGRLRVLGLVSAPSAVPFVLTGLRVGLGNSFMTVVSVEIVSGSSGLGSAIYNARVYYEFDLMFGAILLLGVIGFVADQVFVSISNAITRRYGMGV